MDRKTLVNKMYRYDFTDKSINFINYFFDNVPDIVNSERFKSGDISVSTLKAESGFYESKKLAFGLYKEERNVVYIVNIRELEDKYFLSARTYAMSYMTKSFGIEMNNLSVIELYDKLKEYLESDERLETEIKDK